MLHRKCKFEDTLSTNCQTKDNHVFCSFVIKAILTNANGCHWNEEWSLRKLSVPDSLFEFGCATCLRVRLPGKGKHFRCIRNYFQLPIFKAKSENFLRFCCCCCMFFVIIWRTWWMVILRWRLIKFFCFCNIWDCFGLWLEGNASSTLSRGLE